MLSKSDAKDATLIFLRNMIEAIEEGRMDPISLNVENVPMTWDDGGMMTWDGSMMMSFKLDLARVQKLIGDLGADQI